ncbi:MAG TPA: hypothetical protein VGO50_12260 [Pyrinomonadaceae bacterium]|jgi:hypothetical protein|nr:hypothetical protein [Pyrinomonadaceae bacterium]
MSLYSGEPKLFKLILLGSRDLALAILIGTLIFLPFYAFNEVYIATQIESAFSVLPENDLALETWYHENGLRNVKIERYENTLTITYKKGLMENPNSTWVFPSPEKLAALGYTQQTNLKFSDEFAPSFNILSFIPILIICSQTGFLSIGLWRMRRLKRELGPDKAASKSLLFKLSVGIFAGGGNSTNRISI